MGNDARQRAWKHQGTQGERLLLLALAEHIPDGKHICWPSVDTLSAMVGVGERQIQRLLRTLEEQGVIVAQLGRGRRHTTIYGLLVGLSDDTRSQVVRSVKDDIAMSPFLSSKGDISGQKGDIKPDIAMSPFIPEKVTSGVEKVTFQVEKGDIAMSPEPKGNEIRTERSSSSIAREANGIPPPHQNGGGGGDFIDRLVREFDISTKKAREIAATGVDPETCYQSIRNVHDPTRSGSMGILINRLIDAPPKPGQPYPKPPAGAANGAHHTNRHAADRRPDLATRRTRERYDT